MSADAAREALEAIGRELERSSDVRVSRTKIIGNAHLIVQDALREQPRPDAVVGVGTDGYTFSDGSTPRARDDATLIEALEDAGKLPDEWEHSAELESARAHDDSDAKVAVYRMCARELRAALAAARAGKRT